MKQIRILQAAVAVVVVVALTSCGPSREYSYYPQRSSASFSLIVNPGPGVYVSRYTDGRYYYRSPEGYTYWRGYDNRYYLDRSYLGRVHYDRNEYSEWNRYYKRSGKRYRY